MKILTALLLALTISFAFGSAATSDIAAHNPQVQKAKKDFRNTPRGDAYLVAYEAILKLQKKHREIYDALALGDSVFAQKGLLTLGEIRYEEGKGYSIRFGFQPREADENAAGITDLIIHFDDHGLITKKTIPKYKW